jgi:hypothetical protein
LHHSTSSRQRDPTRLTAPHRTIWLTCGAADGFNIMPPLLSTMLDAFSRGGHSAAAARVISHRLRGTTLREHCSLGWPKGSLDTGPAMVRVSF